MPHVPQTAETPSLAPAEAEIDPSKFLSDRGLETLGTRMVKDHEGNLVPLIDAVRVPCARSAIDAAVEMVRDMRGEDADIVPDMSRYLNRLEKNTQEANTKYTEAKKK